jgi:hypothetical protein
MDDFNARSKTGTVQFTHARHTAVALIAILTLTACGPEPSRETSTDMPNVTASETPAPTPREKPVVKREVPHKILETVGTPPEVTALSPTEERPIQGELPQKILDPILKACASLANVTREQLVIARAQSVVWNDGSLGCPEPGQMYTQALVNGYWVVIEAAGQTYDFRVDHSGNFRLCPQGRGRPPRKSDAS